MHYMRVDAWDQTRPNQVRKRKLLGFSIRNVKKVFFFVIRDSSRDNMVHVMCRTAVVGRKKKNIVKSWVREKVRDRGREAQAKHFLFIVLLHAVVFVDLSVEHASASIHPFHLCPQFNPFTLILFPVIAQILLTWGYSQEDILCMYYTRKRCQLKIQTMGCVLSLWKHTTTAEAAAAETACHLSRVTKLPEEMRAYVSFDVKKTDYCQFCWKMRITNSNHSEPVFLFFFFVTSRLYTQTNVFI